MHPVGLPGDAPELLAKVPKGTTRFSKYLTSDERATIDRQVNRLHKHLTSGRRENWLCDTSSIPGSPNYRKLDGIQPEYDDGYIVVR